MLARLYLRASTNEQDATRARRQLEAFAEEHDLRVAATYVENESGAKLNRPALFHLLSDCQQGDILLVEQVDRLSRLGATDWEMLKGEIASKHVRVVALDLPTSYQLMRQSGDEFSCRMLDAINGMMLDMLAAIARKDYEDRRRRQAEGQAKAKSEGRYRGRTEDFARNASIADMLKKGMSWTQIQEGAKCSRATIAKIAKRAS